MTKTIRTPGARVRGLGAAQSGTEHFWLQRLTAVANLVLTLFLVGLVVALVGRGHEGVVAALGHPLIAIPFLAAIISMCIHMRLGMQIIIEDYVHAEGLKVLALIANTFFAAAVGLAATFALLKISFGG